MMRIVACPLPEFPDYLVSENGDVFSLVEQGRWRKRRANPLRMQDHFDTKGYVRLRLSNAGKTKDVAVHQLVLMAFHGPKPFDSAVGRHLDGCKTNNNYQNLAWGSSKENSADMIRHGRAKGNTSRAKRKFSGYEIACATWFRDTGIFATDVSALTGISKTQVRRLWRGETSGWYELGAGE